MNTEWQHDQARCLFRTLHPLDTQEKPLDEAHEHLHLTSEEFDEVGGEIAKARDHFGVPQREKAEFLAAKVVAQKQDVVNA